MRLSVNINPRVAQLKDDNGVGRVVHAQFKHLPSAGIELTDSRDHADIVATHINGDGLPRVDVLHCHGLYWTGDPGGEYSNWHHDANGRIIETARRSLVVTVPSHWVAEPFKRDMRIRPFVIGHGIDLDEWQPAEKPLSYVLWNKNRNTDVCDPTPALELAKRGIDIVSTFAPRRAGPLPATMRVTGMLDHPTMKELVRHAGIYLATTQETFGIGTLEALAAGVPIVGYRHGGTADIVEHQVNGWLAESGDIGGLLTGIDWIRSNYQEIREAARETARKFDWREVAKEYALVYRAALAIKQHHTGSVAIVITCYNYERFVGDAIKSALNQTRKPAELIIVDDGSKDESLASIERALNEADTGKTRIQIIKQENQGVAAARNNGIRATASNYIICLDADDMLAPQYVDATARYLDGDTGLGVAYTGLMMLNADGTEWGPTGFPPQFDWEHQAKPTNPPATCVPCAAMFRRDMWERAGGYKQVYAPAEDSEFFTRGLSIGYRAKKTTDDHLFRYRNHGGGAHVTKTYKPIDTWHPWMKDGRVPIGAPSRKVPLVYSYSQPLVSVLVPVGPGHGRFLSAAIDSVIGQTCRAWELIIINDSGEPLELSAYPFAKVIESDKRHPGGSRNLGIQAARAPLVLFLDADDFIHPETLARMLDTLAKKGDYYVYCDWVAYDGENANIHKTPEYSQTDWLETLPHSVTALVPTEWARDVGGFDESLPGWEEWDFYLKLALRGYCGVRAAEPLLGYRVTSGVVRNRSQAQEDTLRREILGRYREVKMSGCCGGNGGKVLAQIKQNSYWSTTRSGPAPEEREVVGQTVKVARLEFAGTQIGVQVWRSKINKGRVYRGARDGVNEYIDAHPDDIDYLLSTGFWRVVNQPVEQVQTQAPTGPVAPVAATVPGMTTEEVREIFKPAPAPAPIAENPHIPVAATAIPATNPHLPVMPDIKPEDIDGNTLPVGVTQLGHNEPEEPKKKRGRPAKERGYIEDASEF